jgi:hypothetical protein
MFSTGWVDQFLLSFDRAIKRVRIVDCQEENQFTWHSPIAHSLGFIPSLAALLVLLLKVEPPAICSRHAGFSWWLLFTVRSAPQLSDDIFSQFQFSF